MVNFLRNHLSSSH